MRRRRAIIVIIGSVGNAVNRDTVAELVKLFAVAEKLFQVTGPYQSSLEEVKAKKTNLSSTRILRSRETYLH
jgi:hypothetical protein